MDLEWAVFLLIALATHGAIGYALVTAFTASDPRLGAILAIAPDVDYVFPAEWGTFFIHRGITHTPLFAFVVIASAYVIRRRRSDVAVTALALGSHLVIDAFSPMGLPLLISSGGLPSPGLETHGPVATILFWTLIVILLLTSSPPGKARISDRR